MKKKVFKSVKEELLYISKQNKGFVSPHSVVDFARDPDTKLHNQFEWDDTAAAQQHRLWQARQIISLTLNVVSRGDGAAPVKTRMFVSLYDDRSAERGYRELKAVLSHKSSRDQLLSQALDDLRRVRKNYKELEELAGVFSEIDKLLVPVEVE